MERGESTGGGRVPAARWRQKSGRRCQPRSEGGCAPRQPPPTRKVAGMWFSARRTRVLKEEPKDPATVYAGTTEGLWKTIDGGKTWKHVTNSEVVVNDVLVDPRNPNRVLLATDRSGVLASDDGAQTVTASNPGYTHGYVSSIQADKDA